VIVRSVDFGGLVDHHCLEVIVRFVDIGGLVDPVVDNKSTNINEMYNHL
jgi:hypothetical protein